MKRKGLLLICLLLVFSTLLVACSGTTPAEGTKPAGDGNKKTWPSVSYLTNAEKYGGAGEITHTTSFADGSNGVYMNNATEASVAAYRTQLEAAGWTLAVGPVNNADNVAWGYTKDDLTCSIRLYGAAQTEERSSGDYTFNLYIGFTNDGGTLTPGANALSVPVVTISGSGLAGWSAVPNASGYKYKINGGAEQATQSTSIQLTAGQSIQVKAVGDGTNHTDSAFSASQTYTTGGGSSTAIALSDFDYQLGNHYYISSRWDVLGYDNNDDEYEYQEYRKVALIDGVYFIEKYDFNYEETNAQGNYRQAFYIPDGTNYNEYYRNDISEEFESAGSTTGTDFANTLSVALNETGIRNAKTYATAEALANITAGVTATHTATGRTVKKYTYGVTGTPIYEMYVDTLTKACIKFVNHTTGGHIELSVFSTSGNAWGSNGLPARPDAATPQPTVLSVPVVTINNSGLASWAAVANASGYKIKINGGAEEFAVGLSEQLTDGDTLQVKALGDGETYSDSAYSTIQTYTEQGEDPQPTALSAPVVSISETGLASWAAVTNASGYKYMINFGTEQTAPSDRQVQLINGQSIIVKAVGDGETYSDSAYSEAETYTEVAATYTWPTSTKLTEYGFDGLTKPTGSTISLVGETAATEDEPATLTIVISNGTGEMFDNLTTSLFSMGAINGFNEGSGATFAANDKADLIRLLETYGSGFMGLKVTDTDGVYDAVNVEYYASAGLDDNGDAIAAQTFIVSFAQIDFSSSSPSEPTLGDYVTLAQRFTLTYSSAEGETRTIVKDGDKLWYHIESEYEDREGLAVKQSDGTYNTYEKDNKMGIGSWGTDPINDTITYSDDVYSALGGFEMNLLSYAQCKVNGDVFETGASTTVANMTCNVYTKESSGYTDTYYTYNGLTFKYTERYGQDGPTVYLNVLTYSATGDLSDSKYSIN